MIWSPDVPYGATIGSDTPSSLTRRSIVWTACVTASARVWTTMLGFIAKHVGSAGPCSRSKDVLT